MKHACSPLLLATTILVLGGCGFKNPTATPASDAFGAHATTGSSTANTLQVAATLKLPPASTLVATPKWLWVLGGPSGVLTQIDPATNTVVRKIRPPHPPGFGTYADGSLWIASLLDDAVMQVDADSGRVLRTIESSHGRPFFRPIGIAAIGRDLWVVNHGDDTVRSSLTRLDARTGSVTAATKLPGHHAGGPLLAAGRLWVTLTTEATVVRIDPGTGRVVGSPIAVDTGTCLSGSVADRDAWYTGLDDAEGGACRTVARRLDAHTAALSPTRYGPGKRLTEFASAGGSVWSTDIGHTIYRVDVDSGAIQPALTLDGPDATNRLLAAFGSLWALGGESGHLVRIDVPRTD
jgi:streptogramin lyase